MKLEQHTIASLTQRLGLPRTSVIRLMNSEKLQILGRSCGGRVYSFRTDDIEAHRADYSANLAQRLVGLSANPEKKEDARLIDAWNNATTPEQRAKIWPRFWQRFTANLDFRKTFDRTKQIKKNATRPKLSEKGMTIL